MTYWLWDANQLPAYQACAKGFEKQNPGLKVKITQMGWADYWTKLTASFIAGTEPDVFTDHIQKFGQFADLKVLEPLDDLGIDDSAYQPGLAANWTGQDGHRYGAPKDWDTVALFYNDKMAKEAGLTAEPLNSLSWNPKDGGTFEKAIAHLTVDQHGKRGDEPGFDKNNIKVYGLATGGAGDSDGQTTWSPFAASAGWRYTDKARWGTEYQYGSKTFQSMIDWYFGLAKKGYPAPFTDYTDGANPANAQLAAGKAAASFDGAWMISTYYGTKGLDVGTALTPTGPTGKRATMMNGLADSITKNADNRRARRSGFSTSPRTSARRRWAVTALSSPRHLTAPRPPWPRTTRRALMCPRSPNRSPTSRTPPLLLPDHPVSGLTKTNDRINFILGQ